MSAAFLADLRPAFRGRVLTAPVELAVFAVDASPFRVTPLAVAQPADEADAAELVRRAFAAGVPVTARGGGTGLAGEALGPGIVLDFSENSRRVLEVGPDFVRCEPGVSLVSLAAAVKVGGRRFAPDVTSPACTAGGLAANNASGNNAFRHGSTRDHLRSARVLWDDGTVSTLPGDNPKAGPLTDVFVEFTGTIENHAPRTRFDRCGYFLQAGPDPLQLVVGSEGTLGIFTELTFGTVPFAGGTAVAALGFAAFEDAARAGADLRFAPGITACDLLDQRLLSLARHQFPTLAPPKVSAALLVTLEADTEHDAAVQLDAALAEVRTEVRMGVLLEPSADPAAAAKLKAFRAAAVGGLYALGKGPRPEAFIEDVAVPPEQLAAFAAQAQEILRSFDLTASVLAHPLTGQIHIRPLVDLNDPADRAKLWPAAELVHTLALALGGTVSGQHATGLARTPWVEKQAGPAWAVFREIKRVFDPKGILNPGKIVGPDPSRPAWPLHKPPAKVSLPELAAEAAKCTGCGDCKTEATPARMCPGFRGRGGELLSPRAVANLIQADVELTSDEARSVAGACVHCLQCKSECRAGVDVSTLARGLKAAHFEEHGLSRGDAFFARGEGLSSLAGNFAFTANFLLGSKWGRWAAEKLFGVDRDVLLPRYTHRTFLRRARKLGLTRPVAGDGRKVAYFVDTYANLTDPQIGAAVVAVLDHNGVKVHVPRRQWGTGTARLDAGDFDAVRDKARDNLRSLAPLVRDGYVVLCSEPTAAVKALTLDYPRLLPGDEDAALVAQHTVEFTAYLWRLREAGRLKTDFRPVPVAVGHHVPCHVKALSPDPAGPKLLALIPELRLNTIDAGCSGMAGTFGLRAKNRAASLTAGREMIARFDAPGLLFGSTECGSCRMQMQTAVRKRTLHPAQYLALSYGLLPAAEKRLRTPLGTRIAE